MEIISIIYSPDLKFIAEEIIEYFTAKDSIVFQFNLTAKDSQLIWVNFANTLQVSEIIIPILFPVQKANTFYEDIRDFFELAGRIEEDDKKMYVPVYLHSPEMMIDASEESVRHPEQFFTNILSLNWNNHLASEKNLEGLESKILAMKKLKGIGLESKTEIIGSNSQEKVTTKIRYLISKDRLDQGLEMLKAWVETQETNGKNYQKDALILENKYSSYKKMEMKGIYQTEDLIIEKNKLTIGFIDLIAEIESENDP